MISPAEDWLDVIKPQISGKELRCAIVRRDHCKANQEMKHVTIQIFGPGCVEVAVAVRMFHSSQRDKSNLVLADAVDILRYMGLPVALKVDDEGVVYEYDAAPLDHN